MEELFGSSRFPRQENGLSDSVGALEEDGYSVRLIASISLPSHASSDFYIPPYRVAGFKIMKDSSFLHRNKDCPLPIGQSLKCMLCYDALTSYEESKR